MQVFFCSCFSDLIYLLCFANLLLFFLFCRSIVISIRFVHFLLSFFVLQSFYCLPLLWRPPIFCRCFANLLFLLSDLLFFFLDFQTSNLFFCRFGSALFLFSFFVLRTSYCLTLFLRRPIVFFWRPLFCLYFFLQTSYSLFLFCRLTFVWSCFLNSYCLPFFCRPCIFLCFADLLLSTFVPHNVFFLLLFWRPYIVFFYSADHLLFALVLLTFFV